MNEELHCLLCSFLKQIDLGLSDSWFHCHWVCGTVNEPEDLSEKVQRAGVHSLKEFVWIQSLTEMFNAKLEGLQEQLPVELVCSFMI